MGRTCAGAWVNAPVSSAPRAYFDCSSRAIPYIPAPLCAPAALLVVFAAAAGSVYTVLQKPLLTRYTPLQYTSYVVWTGAAMLLVFAPGLLRAIQEAPRPATYAVVYLVQAS